MSNRKRQQALRLRPCPPDLEKVIAEANLLPHDRPLPDAENAFPEPKHPPSEYIKKGQDMESAIRSSWRKPGHYAPILQEFFSKHFPRKDHCGLRKYLGPISETHWDVALEKYRYLCETVRALDEIASIGAKGEKQRQLRHPGAWISVGTTFCINDEGRIKSTASPFIQAIEGKEANRIRKCPACQKFFWAGRADQPGCGPKCIHALRTRRWREKYQQYKYRKYLAEERREPGELDEARPAR